MVSIAGATGWLVGDEVRLARTVNTYLGRRRVVIRMSSLAILVISFLHLSITSGYAQSAEAYPIVSEDEAKLCGAKLADPHLGSNNLTELREIMQAKPVSDMTYDPVETAYIRNHLSGQMAVLTTYTYQGLWMAADGNEHRVVCTYYDAFGHLSILGATQGDVYVAPESSVAGKPAPNKRKK